MSTTTSTPASSPDAGAHPIVSPQALAEIYAHARRDYPNECCGMIFGPRGQAIADRVEERINAQNQLHALDPERFPRDARRAYNFAQRDLREMDDSLRGDHPAKIIYHSHVEVGAYFSTEDQKAALCGDEPWYPVEYVVIDVKSDGARGAVQFAWDPAARAFVEVARY